MNQNGGLIKEFINPEYKNKDKNLFEEPIGLECIISDYPKLLQDTDEVGITIYD